MVISSQLITCRLGTIKGIKPGTHTLNCELLEETHDPEGGHEFRIIGITRSVKAVLWSQEMMLIM